MTTALQRAQDYCARNGTEDGPNITPDLVADIRTLNDQASIARRLGFNVTLSPYLEALLRIENSKELIHAC